MQNTTTLAKCLPRVGYWWSEKKSRKFNVNEFARICRCAGLELIKIDLERSLEEQGPFAAVVHKLSDAVVRAEQGDLQSKEVCRAFTEYVSYHPDVVVIDQLSNVEKLLDRYRQYKLVEDSELPKDGWIFIPSFVELTTTNKEENIAKLKEAGVEFPFVCKPSLAHGSSFAHKMCLIFSEEGLKDINPPCVAQTFVSHNAVLYKLFIIGDKYFVIERPSLKNFTAGDQETIFFDSHDISKPHSASSLTELDESEPKTPVIPPEKEKLDHIVSVIGNKLGLSLYGIDVIVDNRTGNYSIIDMNTFPGYDGVENFLQLLCDLIVDRMKSYNGISSIIPKFSSAHLEMECRKFLFVPPFTFNHSSSMSLSAKCFCCPITEFCMNVPYSYKSPLPSLCDFSSSIEISAKDVPLNPDSSQTEIKVADSSQEDSGIETSDSCDEKKNKEVPARTVKRQHSRNHLSSSGTLTIMVGETC